MSHLFKKFSRDIIGLVWLSTAIFLSLSLFSYNPTDTSLNAINSAFKADNYCGYFGAFLSDLLYQLFGLSSWILVLATARQSLRSFRGDGLNIGKTRWLWITLLLVTGSSLLALYWPQNKMFGGNIASGGMLGAWMSQALVKIFNRAGVAVILWTAAIVLTVFYTEKSIKELFALPLRMIKKINFKLPLVWLRKIIAANIEKINNAMDFKLVTEAPAQANIQRFLPINKMEMRERRSSPDLEITEVVEPEEMAALDKTENEESENPDKMRRRPISLKKKVQTRIENWDLPKLSLLEDPPYNRKKVDDKEIRDKAQRLVNKMKHFGIEGDVVAAKPGPAVTMFEFRPNADVKISRITDLADDLSLELSSESVRIIAPIPGRDVVGIETSNSVRETVYLKEILASEEFWDDKISLPLALGCEVDGTHKVVDLRKMPHMLVAGTTGSGKSVFVVSLLTGLLFRHSPKTLRLILVDPKQVDLAVFSKVPHLLMPPIREPKKAINALRWAIKEMEKRYRSMAKFGARDLESFNMKVSLLDSEKMAQHEEFNAQTDPAVLTQQYYYTPQPYTVIIVEEFGDLMSVDKNNVEQSVVRLAQMARACGIHLILAMQSPRREVVTGLIKTNIPGRVSFKVAGKMDSRIILDEAGAERLLSRGDMLFLAPGVSKPHRHHGPWVTDAEIQEVADFWTKQAPPEFDTSAMRALEGSGGGEMQLDNGDAFGEDEFDERYDEILGYISTLKEVSASHIQTRFRLGYPRAARLIEVFEQQGVVGPASGSKKRQVLVNELK